MKTIEILHPDFPRHIDPEAQLEIAASGFRFLEGPVWDPRNDRLIFSDIIGNALYTYAPPAPASHETRSPEPDSDTRNLSGTVEMLRSNSYLANGNTLDLTGSLLTCEHATSRISRTDPDGSYTVLAEKYKGRQLNSPNDIVVKSDGMIYFTDPASGRGEKFGIPRKQELPYQGVFKLDPDSGELTLLADDFILPNGLCFSPDETTLYVNDTLRQHIRCFDVDQAGLLRNGRLFAELLQDKPTGKADGMKFDSKGYLFCTGPGGIQIFNQHADIIGRILIPEQTANFCWGDPDLRALYITASKTLYRIRGV
jgi:gluconolactonase